VLALVLLIAFGRVPHVQAADDTVTLNFVNADIDAVIRAVAEITGRNFVVDPRVKGTDQHRFGAAGAAKSVVYPTLLSALRLQGFTAIEGDGIVKVVPETDAKQQGGRSSRRARHRGGDRLVTQVITLAVRIGGAAGQRAAPADHAEQHDLGVPRDQRADHHRLRRQPAAASSGSSPRSTSRLPASRYSCRALRVGARHRGNPQPDLGRPPSRPRRAARPTLNNG
jgi:molybdopterin-guanine dinucleotide biosynthesis protein